MVALAEPGDWLGGEPEGAARELRGDVELEEPLEGVAVDESKVTAAVDELSS